MPLAVLVTAVRRAADRSCRRTCSAAAPIGAYLARLLYLGAMIGFFYFGNQYLQDVLGFTAVEAGVAFLPMTVVKFVAMAWLSRVSVSGAYWDAVASPMVLIGAA